MPARNFSVGDNVKFQTRIGWNGVPTTWFDGRIEKRNGRKYITGDTFEDIIPLNDSFVTKVKKV